MAQRGIFIAKDKYPFFEEIAVGFEWFPGQYITQRQKSALSLEMNFEAAYPDIKLCEISSASLSQVGISLSAMNLSKRLADGRITTVESAFQSSRIYCDPVTGETVGPFPDMVMLPGRECKKRVKELSRGLHSYEYSFDGMWFPAPTFHISLFYDYLYLTALTEPENADTAARLLESGFEAFSDIATKSLNTQARSCAIYVGLSLSGQIGCIGSYEDYLKLMRVDTGVAGYGAAYAFEDVQLLDSKGNAKLLRPAVAQSVTREQVLDEYARRV